MDAVKSFNAELAGLYECKPPISKAKMTAITKGAIRAIKFYKHVVQSVEKFIQKCKTEYKIPGLYVIDSIVRQSRHQFGIEKDVFAPRFAKNILITFYYLFKCPQEDKSKVIRVLNLWQKNQVFAEEVIQPLFDLADPNHHIQKEVSNQIAQKASKAKVQQHPVQEQPQVTPTSAPGGGGGGGGGSGRHDGRGDNQINNNSASMPQQVDDECKLVHLVNQQHPVPVTSVSSQVMSAAVTNLDPSLIQQIQQILMKQPSQDDGAGMAAAAAAAAAAGMVPPVPDGIGPPVPEEVKGQGIPGLANTEWEEQFLGGRPCYPHSCPTIKSGATCTAGGYRSDILTLGDYDGRSLPFLTVDTSQPPPGYIPPGPFMGGMPPAPMAVPPPTLDFSQVHPPPEKPKSPREEGEHSDDSEDVKEIHHEDHDSERHRRSRSRSRSRSRRRRRTRSRSRSRSRSRHRRSRSRSRGRRSSSRSRRRRSRSRDRDRDRERDRRDRDRDRDRDREREKEREKEKLDPEKEREREKEREKERERKKRGLPPCKKEHLSVCSTTLWVGHLSKLVHQEELSDTFGEYGDIVSIDLIPPRGCAFICMNRRQDAARALSKLKNHKMHNKAITLAWAPGKGVKGKEFKDYWEVEVGCSYIPFHKLITMSNIDLDNLEEGGMIDEETVPDWLRGRYGLEGAPPGPPPGFVPIGVPPGHPPNTRSQEIVAPLPPMPPPPPVEKPQEVPREGPPPLPANAPGLPPNMMPPPFGLPNMPPPQVGHGPGPGGMPPLPQGFVPPNLPPLGVPPPLGLPPLGVHPPVSSILGQPLIGAMPPPVSMAPSMPNRPLMPPGSEMQNNVNSGPITTIANSGHMGSSAPMVNSNSHTHESNDMDIEMEDVEKNDMGKENGLPSKEKDDHAERQHDRQHRFERSVAHSSPSGEDKMGLVERLRNLASGGEIEPRDKYDRERRDRDRDRDRDRGREVHERDDRIHDRDRDLDSMRGRANSRFGPDAFSGPPPGFPPPGQRPDGPPNFRPDGSGGPNGPIGHSGPGGPGGFNNFVPVPGFGPPGGGSGGPPGLMGGPPGPHGHAGIRNDGFGHMRMGMMSGPTGPGFGPRGMHGGFNGPRGLLGPPPMGMGPLMGNRPPLLGDMPGGPNGSMGLRGPGGMPGQRPGMWMEGPGPRFQGHDVPHGGPPGTRDGLPDRPWDTDRSREGDRPSEIDRFRDGDRSRDDDRPHDMDRDRSMDRSMDDRPMDDRPRNDRSRDDRPRDDRSRDDRSRDDRSRDDRSRDDRSRDDRTRDDRTRDDRSRDDRSRDDRSRDDRSRDDRSRDDRSRDDRSRDDRSRNDRSRDDRSRDDRSRDDRSRDDRSRDDRSRDDRSRGDRSRGDRSRDERSRDDRSREDRSRDDRSRENRYRDDRSRDDRSRDDRIRDNDRSWDSKSRDNDRRRDDRRSWEKPRWGPREEEEPVVEMEDGEPGSWDVWAMMSAGDFPLPKLGVKGEVPKEEKLKEEVQEKEIDRELPKEEKENITEPKNEDKELKHDIENIEHKQGPLNVSALTEVRTPMEVETFTKELSDSCKPDEKINISKNEISDSENDQSAVNPQLNRALQQQDFSEKDKSKVDTRQSMSLLQGGPLESNPSTVNTQLNRSQQQDDIIRGHSENSFIFHRENINNDVERGDHKSQQPKLLSFSDKSNQLGENFKAECSKRETLQEEDNNQQEDSKQDKFHQKNFQMANIHSQDSLPDSLANRAPLQEEPTLQGLPMDKSSKGKPLLADLERGSQQRLHVQYSESEEPHGYEGFSPDFAAAKMNNNRVVDSAPSDGNDNQEEQDNACADGYGQANVDTDMAMVEKDHEEMGGEDSRVQDDDDDSQLNED